MSAKIAISNGLKEFDIEEVGLFNHAIKSRGNGGGYFSSL